MPRPKGSKNKKTIAHNNVDSLDLEKISGDIQTLQTDIEKLNAELKSKKQQLKDLIKARDKAARIAAEKKAEEDKKAIFDAVMRSGKTVEEILELLK